MKPAQKKSIPNKRGRKKKPIIPLPAAPPAEMSLDDAQGLLVKQCQERLREGRTPPNPLLQALRDAWLLQHKLHLWHSVEDAAAELGVSPSTVRGFKADGCPGMDENAAPICKALVLGWLLKRAHERGAAPNANKDTMEEVDLRLKMAKTHKIERALIAEAEDLARQGVVNLIGKMRHHLLHVLPGQIYDLILPAGKPAQDKLPAEDLVARLIAKTLDDFKRHPTASEPAPSTVSSPTPTQDHP